MRRRSIQLHRCRIDQQRPHGGDSIAANKLYDYYINKIGEQ
nr:hypothetical protein [Methylomarinum sp. Ch1-1]MDP4522337.1 hypothetical protein [Methylomarinum sp. Ch1-1]